MVTTARRWNSKAAAALCFMAGIADPIGAIHALIDELLRQAEATAPQPDLLLLAQLRLVRRIEALGMVEAGRLVPEGDGYVIHVNRRHSKPKRAFTTGHEISHTFFKEALAVADSSIDAYTGLFNIRAEEEYLCDIGASHMLLHPTWLEGMARKHQPSLQGLHDIARDCGTSLESAAFQLARSYWTCTFVFWEPGLKDAEQVNPQQASFDGWAPLAPMEHLRVSHVYRANGLPFLPRKKSVHEGSHIHRALREQCRTAGEESIDTGRQQWPAYCESEYAPYYDDAGVLRPRVLSCIEWRLPSAPPRHGLL